MNYEILVATNNQHKLKEIRAILSPHHITVYGIKDLNLNPEEVDENGSTYYENGLIKAKSLAKLVKIPVIADDSGLEIKSLDNKPGIHSARYAEKFSSYDEAFKQILKEINGKDTSATFYCDIVMLNVEEKPLLFEGIVKGHIVPPTKALNGFGYDPIFKVDELDKTYAEMDEKEKNIYSHRAKALKKLLTYLLINNLAD